VSSEHSAIGNYIRPTDRRPRKSGRSRGRASRHTGSGLPKSRGQCAALVMLIRTALHDRGTGADGASLAGCFPPRRLCRPARYASRRYRSTTTFYPTSRRASCSPRSRWGHRQMACAAPEIAAGALFRGRPDVCVDCFPICFPIASPTRSLEAPRAENARLGKSIRAVERAVTLMLEQKDESAVQRGRT
jgi:hypothetical protein